MNREGMMRASTTTDRYSFLEEALSFYKYVMENCTNSLDDYQVRYLFVRHLQLMMRWAIWADCDKLIYGKRSVLGRMDYPIPKCHNDGTRA